MLSAKWAVLWAAFFNFIAFLFFGLHVAKTVGSGIIDPHLIGDRMIFAALMGAISWNLITWWAGIPSSSSHALIGGLVGASVAKVGGFGAVQWAGLGKTAAGIVVSPLFGFLLALLLVLLVSWTFLKSSPFFADRVFRKLQFISAAAYSLGHGGSDAQKTMGIIAALLFAHGATDAPGTIPLWVVLSCQAAMAFGTLFGGWRIVHTMGSKITRPDSDAGLLRGDRRRDHFVPGDPYWRSGLDDSHDHGRYCRCRRLAPGFGRSAGAWPRAS